jgi:serine/threonine protein kinase
MAPELIKRQTYSYVASTHQPLDVYAVALIAHILLTGKHPFKSDSNAHQRLRARYSDWDTSSLSA